MIRLWLFKMADDESWQLLGQAGFKNKHHWALPPITLGESGDELIIMAVVVKQKMDALNVQAQGNVTAASERVRVKLQ